MPWSDERRAQHSRTISEHIKSLSPEDRIARTAKARQARLDKALPVKHARWAEEMRQAGWLCVEPGGTGAWTPDSEPCGG